MESTTATQATTQNKRLFASALGNLDPQGMAHFGTAFKYAFDTFDRFDRDVKAQADRTGDQQSACDPDAPPGAACNKVIMVLTDAMADYPVDLIRRRNKDKRIKIFTYAMGFAAREKENMKVNGFWGGGGRGEWKEKEESG